MENAREAAARRRAGRRGLVCPAAAPGRCLPDPAQLVTARRPVSARRPGRAPRPLWRAGHCADADAGAVWWGLVRRLGRRWLFRWWRLVRRRRRLRKLVTRLVER